VSDSVQRYPSTHATFEAWVDGCRPATPPTEEEGKYLWELLIQHAGDVLPTFDLLLTNYLRRRGQRAEDLSAEERYRILAEKHTLEANMTRGYSTRMPYSEAKHAKRKGCELVSHFIPPMITFEPPLSSIVIWDPANFLHRPSNPQPVLFI
jgi:hypothetical protein